MTSRGSRPKASYVALRWGMLAASSTCAVAQKRRSTNLPRRAARSSGRPSAAFAAIAGARSPTFSSRNGKTSSGMAPMSSGSSLRPPGIAGTTTVGPGEGLPRRLVAAGIAAEGQLQDVSPGGHVLDPERPVGAGRRRRTGARRRSKPRTRASAKGIPPGRPLLVGQGSRVGRESAAPEARSGDGRSR